MFDSLLVPKFSNKCKHSVKAIKCRMETILKKKHATVRFLEKDVADLISCNHDANAFGRMDTLLSQINQAWCYDMIEKYCCCVMEHLPTMQKERVCPEETTEAVATLIFAAARCSDLPELVDLRRCFTTRYGSNIESYRNTEFVEKMQTKSFSQENKLQLMQEIAHEYRVCWDAKSFEYMISNSSTPTFDPRLEVLDRRNDMINGRETEHHSRNSVHKQQELPKEHRNFHTTPYYADCHPYNSTEKIDKVAGDESENIKPHYFAKRVPDTLGVLERQGMNDKAASMIPPYSKFTGDFNGTSSSQYSFVHSVSERKHNGEEKQHNGPVNPENSYITSNPIPPYVKPRTPLATGYVEPGNYSSSSSEYGDNFKKTPFSVRTKHLRQEKAANTDSSGEDGIHTDVNNHQSFIASQSKKIEDDPICGTIYHGRHMYRTLSDKPKHMEDDSICGIIYHGRGKYRAYGDQPRDGTYGNEGDCSGPQTVKHEEYSEVSANPLPRTSLHPPESPVRKQARSFSMQPDRPSADGRRRQQKPPNYDELAARIAELRNS